MMTAHLAAKPLLTINFIYIGYVATNISWPHDTHWPHSSLTVIGRIRALQFYRPEVTMTAHLAAKPLLCHVLFTQTLLLQMPF